MKLFIKRLGSGFGGSIHGKYFVNLDNMSYSEISDEEFERISKSSNSDKERTIALEKHSTDKRLKGKYSALKDLKTLEKEKTPVSFDMQTDIIYAIENGEFDIVYAPCSAPYITIKDEGVEEIIFKLFDEISGKECSHLSIRKLAKEASSAESSEPYDGFIIGEVTTDETAKMMIDFALKTPVIINHGDSRSK